MSSLELKVPPPLVALVFAFLMWFASSLFPPLGVPHAARVAVAVFLAVIGVSCSIAGMLSFWRARTTMNPTKPTATSSLVRSGVYRLTRNPMYLGLMFDLAAWSVFLSSVLALLLLPVFMFYINRLQIIPEERALSALFGADYAAYKQTVRRWL